MNRIARFLNRSSVEKRLFREAAVLVPMVRIAIAMRGFRSVRRWLDRRVDDRALTDGVTPEIIEWAVQSVAKRTMYDKPCLTQSLVVSHFLRRAGYRPDICIGVKKVDDRLEAHAWVELEGVVVSGGRRAPEIYTPLTSL